MKGGYKIIDFNNVSLSSTAVTIAGLVEAISLINGKAVLLTNVVIGDEKMDDCFTTFIDNGDGTGKFNCYDGYISINSSGAVTYTVASNLSIPELINSVNNINSLNGVSVASENGIVNQFNKLDIYQTVFGRFAPAVLDTIFGINNNANFILTKVATTTFYLLASEPETGHICIARATVSDNVINWRTRFIFEGTVYTPTL